MEKKYDIIVIGGGHNGLTAASLLAKRGKKVLLIEKRPILGGVAAGEEFHPGYRSNGLLHDTGAIRTQLLKPLHLERYGLKTAPARAPVALLQKGGKGIFLHSHPKRAAAAISRFSEKDARAYLGYRKFVEKIGQFINPLINEVPPDLVRLGTGDLWELAKKGLALKRLGNKNMLELLKVAPMSVADFLNEWFETEFLKAGLAAPAIYASYTGPWSSYTTLNLLLWECAAQTTVIGGPQALIAALDQSARANGVEIQTGIAVEKILLKQAGAVQGVRLADGTTIEAPLIAASCTPQATFLNLLAPYEIAYPLEQGMLHYRSRGTTAKVNLALDRPLSFDCEADEPIAFARTGNSFVEMEKAFDPVKYRNFSEEPILDIHLPTVATPKLAPVGHCVASILVHFAPHHFDTGWSEDQKEKLGQKVMETLEQYIPSVSEAVVAREILSPKDLEDRYGLTQGHVFHGEHAVDQLLTRPIPSCARYRTPIPGLYLCGSGSHPGGGLSAAPGALASGVILKEQ